MTQPLLRVRGVRKYFPVGGGLLGRRSWVRAVDGVDLDVAEGETVALVGESGCGKSTLGRVILRLIEADAGQIEFAGQDVRSAGRAELRALRRRMQIIFQDPYSSLNPRMTVGEAIGEGLVIHRMADRAGRHKRVAELLEIVGLAPEHAQRYPHEFSGGQRQRIGVARALALEPSLIVADEPVSSLDVSVLADRVSVMYLGKLVESAPAEQLYRAPQHPYTEALLSAVPLPDPTRAGRQQRIVLEGDVPSPTAPPPGCPFHPRCPKGRGVGACRRDPPALRSVARDHVSACHLAPF